MFHPFKNPEAIIHVFREFKSVILYVFTSVCPTCHILSENHTLFCTEEEVMQKSNNSVDDGSDADTLS